MLLRLVAIFWVLVLMTGIFNVEPGKASNPVQMMSRWRRLYQQKRTHIYIYIYWYTSIHLLSYFRFLISASCLLSKYEFVDSWYSMIWHLIKYIWKVAKDNLQMYDLVRSHAKDLQQIKSHKSLCRIHIFVCSISWYCNDGNIQGSLSSLVVQVFDVVVMILEGLLTVL